MTTQATVAALQAHDSVLCFEIDAIGRRSGHNVAGTSPLPWRLTSRPVSGAADGGLVVDRCVHAIVDVPEFSAERLNLREVRTELSACSIRLQVAAVPSGTIAAQGFASLLDALSVQTVATSWRLTVSATAGAGAFTLDSVVGITVGQALWIGAEVVVVVGLPGGLVINVSRGQLGTTAREHRMPPAGDGTLWDRPRYLRGLRARLILQHVEPSTVPAADGSVVLCDVGTETVLWAGLIDDWQMPSAGVMDLQLRSFLARLDRSIGRQLWAAGVFGFGETTGRDWAESLPIGLHYYAAATYDERVPWEYPIEVDIVTGRNFRRFHARLGDQIVEIRAEDGADADGLVAVEIVALRLAGTDSEPVLDDGTGERAVHDLREVMLTDPRPRGSDYFGSETPLAFYRVGGVAAGSAHPIDLLLCHATSTGAGGASAWDSLPGHWGCSVAIGDFDKASFLRLRDESGGLEFPRFYLGSDGTPVRLRQWAEAEMLAPLGWFLVPRADGKIGLERLRDVYPLDVPVVLGEAQIVPDSLSMAGGLQSTISSSSWRFCRTLTGEWLRTRRYLPQVARDRLADDDSEIAFELPGARGDRLASGIESMIGARADQIARWWASPAPALTLSVLLRDGAALSLGQIVAIDVAWPSPFDGSRRLSCSAMVVSRRLDLAAGKVDLVVQTIPAANLAHWAPAATVVAWNAGLLEATCAQYDFVGEETSWISGTAPQQFRAGDEIGLYSLRGVPLCDVSRAVTLVGVNTIRIGVAWTLGGVPVVPAAGDIIQYSHYSGPTPPSAVWTATMKDFAAQAEAAGTLGGTADTAYRYGG